MRRTTVVLLWQLGRDGFEPTRPVKVSDLQSDATLQLRRPPIFIVCMVIFMIVKINIYRTMSRTTYIKTISKEALAQFCKTSHSFRGVLAKMNYKNINTNFHYMELRKRLDSEGIEYDHLIKKNHYRYKFDIFQIKEIVANSKSISDIGRKLNVKSFNFRSFYKLLDSNNIDHSHIPKGHSSNKNRVFETRRLELKNVLKKFCVSKSHYSNKNLIIYIKRHSLIPYKCFECGNDGHWRNKPISLHLHHLNGNHCDNRLENLKFVCPNCHAQTETYCGKNSKQAARVGIEPTT